MITTQFQGSITHGIGQFAGLFACFMWSADLSPKSQTGRNSWRAIVRVTVNRPHKQVVSHSGFHGQHHALDWDLATRGAVKYAPQGQIVGSVLELMLGPRSHEQDVA
jgi:hypothetical protein